MITITYYDTHNIGITPDNPTGKHIVERSYRREEYNAEEKTPYKEAVANARFWKYVDYEPSEESFRKDYEQEVLKILIDQERGGVSWSISQEKWLKIMDAAAHRVTALSAALWDKYH